MALPYLNSSLAETFAGKKFKDQTQRSSNFFFAKNLDLYSFESGVDEMTFSGNYSLKGQQES